MNKARMTKRAVCLLTLLLAAGSTAAAQVISIKTVPLAQPDQFQIFPSRALSMGGVSLALPDTLYDLSTNPATGGRLHRGQFFSAPFLYSLSQSTGSGRTLPLGAATRFGSWFGGVSLALQQVDMPGQGTPVPVPLVGLRTQNVVPTQQVVQRGAPRGNEMAFALLGKKIPGSGLSVGASALWARLTAVDGVDFLYSGSSSVVQSGHVLDVRVGLLNEWPDGRSLEALVVRNDYAMTHNVTFQDFFWDPASQFIVMRPRLEENLDRTNTWGVHLAYQQPLAQTGWRIGGIATGNRLFHPDIPTYDMTTVGVQWIPWDPGDSWAYNLGVGLSRSSGGTTLGVDAIYEPIWTHTWGEAHAATVTALNDTIPVGGRTVDNYFTFSNAHLRLGFAQDMPFGEPGARKAFGVQGGLAVHSIIYHLAQYDVILARGRNQDESWVEWTPTWGFSLRFPELELRYQGRVTHGTGRPGVTARPVRGLTLDSPTSAGSIVAAPDGPLTLGEVSVTSHIISISVPLGRLGSRGGAR